MKNIAVTLDEDTYERAEKMAAEMKVSLADLVASQIRDLAADTPPPIGSQRFAELKQLQFDVLQQAYDFTGADRLPRDELYHREKWR